jgi:hypothetical protein
VHLIALWNGQADIPKDRDARLVRHMIDLTRDLGGAIDQINTSKYLFDFMNTVLDRLIFEGTPETTTAKGPRSRKAISASKSK